MNNQDTAMSLLLLWHEIKIVKLTINNDSDV